MFTKRTYLFIIFLIILLLSIFWGSLPDGLYLVLSTFYKPIPELSTLPPESRLLIIAPHCDDEVLSAAGVIKKVIRTKGKVQVVVMTNGDGFTSAVKKDFDVINPGPADFMRLGYMRQEESIAAIAKLGVGTKDIFFLGYPDRGLSYLWRINWQISNPFNNPKTKTTYTPYETSYHVKAAYAGENVVKDLSQIFLKFKPTIIIYPHSFDQHPDHWTSYFFVKYALAQIAISPPQELLYLIHHQSWPAPRKKHMSLNLFPPREIITYGRWEKYTLPRQDILVKEACTELYQSQLTLMSNYLFSFVRRNELFNTDKSISIHKTTETTTLLTDPQESLWKRLLDPAADLKSITFKQKQHTKYLDLELSGKISPNYIYYIDLTTFRYNHTAWRYNIRLIKNKLSIRSLSQSNIPSEKRIQVHLEKNHIFLLLPPDFIQEIHALMINTSSFKGPVLIDRTIGRFIKIIP